MGSSATLGGGLLSRGVRREEIPEEVGAAKTMMARDVLKRVESGPGCDIGQELIKTAGSRGSARGLHHFKSRLRLHRGRDGRGRKDPRRRTTRLSRVVGQRRRHVAAPVEGEIGSLAHFPAPDGRTACAREAPLVRRL